MDQASLGAPAALLLDSSDARAPTLSRQLWGLDWNRLTPWKFDDVDVEMGTIADALPFMAEHYGGIFGSGDEAARFLHEPMTPAKMRFSELSDVFLFRSEQRLFGIMLAHPTDWTTYYIRSTAFLPEFRNKKVMMRFVHTMCEHLRGAGVRRLETEVSPSNQATQHAQMSDGWMVTGTVTSERWGAMLRWTKYLHEDARSTFLRQFCITPK
jgi:hypothetical protein